MSTQVFLNGSVYSPADPFATAMVVSNGTVEWVGQDAGARSILDPSMTRIELSGDLISPAFALAAVSAEPGQVDDVLDELEQAGYGLAHLMLTSPLENAHEHSAVTARYYIPANRVSTEHLPDPSTSGVYFTSPADMTQELLEFAVNNRLNLVAVPADDSVAEEYLATLEGLDSLARLKVSPRLDGLLTLDDALIEKAKNLNVSLGFSSGISDVENSYSQALSIGASVMLGSDPLSSFTRLGWELVYGAVAPLHGELAVSARAAFQSITRAVYRAQGESTPWGGQLVPGAPADFVRWHVTELMVQTPDSRISAWSTDPRARTPLLPVLADDVSRPRLKALYKTGQKTG